MSTQATIEKLREFFTDKPVLRAYLFGSYSRGDDREDSDIDILVDLDYSQPIGLEFVRMKLDLEDMLRRKVDLISERGLSKHVRPYVERDKKLVYERQHRGQSTTAAHA